MNPRGSAIASRWPNRADRMKYVTCLSANCACPSFFPLRRVVFTNGLAVVAAKVGQREAATGLGLSVPRAGVWCPHLLSWLTWASPSKSWDQAQACLRAWHGARVQAAGYI